MTAWIDTLVEDGFAVIPGPIPAARQERFSEAYDAAVAAARPPELAIGRTSTRAHGLVNDGAEFDELYIHPPLLGRAPE